MTNSRSGRPLPFHRREFLVITYETDAELIRAQLTEPLEPIDRPLAHYEYVWIKMPDSSGFGSYTELGLVIPACRSATWSGRMMSVSERQPWERAGRDEKMLSAEQKDCQKKEDRMASKLDTLIPRPHLSTKPRQVDAHRFPPQGEIMSFFPDSFFSRRLVPIVAPFRSSSPQEAPFLAENVSAMTKMMIDMGIRPSGDVDSDFVAMMAPHHQGAIEMAQAELRHGHNEQLRRMAQEIIVTQQQEIAAMRLALGQPLPASVPSPDQIPPVGLMGSEPDRATQLVKEQ
jgi:hypothetical protein